MFISEVRRIVEQISRDKGIEGRVLFRALEEALRSAAKKKFGNRIEVEVSYNSKIDEIEIFQFREVVDNVEDKELQISFRDGVKLDPHCELGDSLGSKIDVSTFGRMAVQSAKQVIIQRMKDAERDAVYFGYVDKKGEIINGIVHRIDRGNIIVNLGITEGILRLKEQIQGEIYTRGDRIRALILDILYDTKGPQVILSRIHPDFLVILFKTEVPEIMEGLVEVKGAVREPGIRAKFSVISNDSDIDPIGACVGVKGNRVQNIVNELKGEKIDIVMWHLDPVRYVCNALAPAEITRVIIDEENHSMEIVVSDEFLSIAIGKRGQNVRLASKLTGWRLDVYAEGSYDKSGRDKGSLLKFLGIDGEVVKLLVNNGVSSISKLANSKVNFLSEIDGIERDFALKLVVDAKAYLLKFSRSLKFSKNKKFDYFGNRSSGKSRIL